VPGFDRSRWPATAGFLVAVHVAGLAGVGLGSIVTHRRRVVEASLLAVASGAGLLALWAAAGRDDDALRALQLGGAAGFQVGPWEEHFGSWRATLPARGAQLVAAGVLGLVLTGTRIRLALVWIALLVADLSAAAGRLGPPAARGFYDGGVPDGVLAIRAEVGERRIFTPRATDQLGNFLYGARSLAPFEWARRAMLCNANVPFGVAQANGCEPLGSRRHDAFVQAFESVDTPWEIKERIFDLWDAALFVASDVRPLDVPHLGPDAGVELSRHEPRLARAQVVSGWRTHDDPTRLLAELLSPDHDPALFVLLEAAPGGAEPPPPSPAHASARTVSWEARQNAFHAEWEEGPSGMLRVLETWAPGWEATVNREPAPVHRADFLFLAVPVPEGPCRVDLVYRPDSVRRGLWLSLAGLLIIAGCLVFDRPTHSPSSADR
jgi:hypothetical protein